MKLAKPAKVRIRLADGTLQPVSLARHRGRYLEAERAILPLLAADAGAVVELLDSGGALLRTYAPAGPEEKPADDDDDDEDDAGDVEGDVDDAEEMTARRRHERWEARQSKRDERLLALLLKAQASAVSQLQESTRDLMAQQRALTDAVSARLAGMEKMHTGMLRTLYDVTIDAAQAQADATATTAEATANTANAESVEKMVTAELVGTVIPMLKGKMLAVAAPK